MVQVIKSAYWIVLGTLSVAVAAPAAACPGPSAEKFLVWYGLPELMPGEVAIEIDMKDVLDNYSASIAEQPTFKVKRVLVGKFDGSNVHVQTNGSSCSRDFAVGASDQMVLVGHLREVAGAEPRLVARYMSFDDPIRIEAEREAQRRMTDKHNSQRPRPTFANDC